MFSITVSTQISSKTKICESETTFFNVVNLLKHEKAPYALKKKSSFLHNSLKKASETIGAILLRIYVRIIRVITCR